MSSNPRLSFALLALCFAPALLGCASGWPFWSYDAGQAGSAGGGPAYVDQGQTPYSQTSQALPPSSPVRPTAHTNDGKQGNMFFAALSKTTRSMSDALTIEPKVIPAADPVRLGSKPGKIDPSLYVAAARLAEGQGNIQKAAEQYQQALELDSTDLSALVGSARLNDRQGKYDQAIELYRQAVKSHPQSALAVNDLGLCLARRGEVDASLEAFHRAIKLEPGGKRYRNNIATVLVEAGRPDEALKHFTYAHGEAVAHYNLGFLLLQRGDRQRARHHLQQAADLNPSLTQAREAVARLQKAAAPEPTRQSYHPAPTPRPQYVPENRTWEEPVSWTRPNYAADHPSSAAQPPTPPANSGYNAGRLPRFGSATRANDALPPPTPDRFYR